MKQCKSIGCSSLITDGSDRCIDCQHQHFLDQAPVRPSPALTPAKPQPKEVRSAHVGDEPKEATSSGGDNDYWIAQITHPKRLKPYEAECEDLIEHFQMSFQEGEAFKALWRKGQARIGNGKPGDSALRNAQKVRHFGARMEVMEARRLETVD